MKKGIMILNKEEKAMLLGLARQAVARVIAGGSRVEPMFEEEAITDNLKERHGVFVAIYREGCLLGCMGSVLAVLPLWQACVEAARNAALKDVRFGPLHPKDLPALSLEVVVIGPKRILEDPGALCPGTAGLILRKGFRQEAFMPKAVSGLIRNGYRMLDGLKSKAGIDPQDDAPEVWEVFEAQVFSDGADSEASDARL